MDVLPWLLDWPPRPASIAVFLVLTVASVGTLVVFGGVTDEITTDNVTIETTGFDVRLNDELTIPDTNGSVETCLGSRTPGDSFSVVGDVTVDSPAERDGRLTLVVSLAHTDQETTQRIDGGRETQADVFWVLNDDETLSVGHKATVQLRVLDGDTTLASASRAVTVEEDSRSYDC